jgi:putative DNA primase/helicase
MNDFAAFVVSLGLLPSGAIVPDGRWHRCPTEDHPKKNNGAWKLAPDGGIGWVQNHAVHAEPLTWRPTGHTPAVPIDQVALRRAQAREREERARASEEARGFYRQCRPLAGGHDYLSAHGLDMCGCAGLRVDRRGWLVVPMCRGGELVSVQRIAPDGEKRFWTGAPINATSYTLDRAGATLTILCEGLATALALYAAVPLSRVVVAFNAGNLPRVATQAGYRGMVAVAADNDHRTVCPQHRADNLPAPYQPWADRPDWCRCNPGKCYASETAEILGCGYAVPEGIEGTDFCDLRTERVAQRLAVKVYGRRQESETAIRRAVDAEITACVMRAARFRAG